MNAEDARVPTSALVVLHIVAFAAGPWAVYQWMELVTALAGGEVACAVNARFDCRAVWSAPVAKAIQHWTGVPVAGWGLVWALAAFIAPLRLSVDRIRGKDARPGVWGVWGVAAVGVAVAVGLFAVSLSVGAFCLTCLVTYGVVGVYAGVGWGTLRTKGPAPSAVSSFLPVFVAVVAGWLLLLWPGLSTPIEGQGSVLPAARTPSSEPGQHPQPAAADDTELRDLIKNLPPQGRAALVQGLESLKGPPPVEAAPRPRRIRGDPKAPVLLTDFSDILCGHCQNLARALAALEGRVGERFAEDARYFPLASECNPHVPPEVRDPSGVRCLGARLLLCFEARPEYYQLRNRLFERGSELTQAGVIKTAQEVLGLSEQEIEACREDTLVTERLEADIEYAMMYKIRGTPLTLVNGREFPAHPTLLYAIILAGGDPEHPAFQGLASSPSH